MSESRKARRQISLELLVLGIVIIAIYVVFNLMVGLAVIQGTSMEPTLNEGDLILVQKQNLNPQPGDIVLIDDTVYDNSELIKRVIAVEGDVVNIDFITGYISVNGKRLEEPYTNTPTNKEYDVQFPITVKKGCVFVLGDNRNLSLDSRSSKIGCIPIEHIEGTYITTIRSAR